MITTLFSNERRRFGNRSNHDGFTIVELLIVIVVIAILAAITLISFNNITNRANDTAVQSDVDTLRKKTILDAVDKGKIFTPSGISQSTPGAQDIKELTSMFPISQGSYVGSGVAFVYSVRNEEGSNPIPVFAAVSKSNHVFLFDGAKLRQYNGNWNEQAVIDELRGSSSGSFGWSCNVQYYKWSRTNGWQIEPEYC